MTFSDELAKFRITITCTLCCLQLDKYMVEILYLFDLLTVQHLYMDLLHTELILYIDSKGEKTLKVTLVQDSVKFCDD